jgi:oligopeptide/dipeptide ABC transporter ATP-binding protein
MSDKQSTGESPEVNSHLSGRNGNQNLLDVRNLRVEFHTSDGTIIANKDISLSVPRGKTLGIVGESGSGKSVFCRSILRLIPSPPGEITGGEVCFEGQDLLELSEAEMEKIRGVKITMIFQDPMTSLNPVWRIGDQITEGLRIHEGAHGRQERDTGIQLLQQVGIPSPEKRIDEYPHRLSGGMRQRVMIAMAIAMQPALLLADEPTTALDVTIQDQILALMLELQEMVGMSLILVSHDMGIVAETSDRVAVMYAGQVLEEAATEEIFSHPQHPYTMGLLLSIPRMDKRIDRLVPIKGQPPNLLRLPRGCPFTERCPIVMPDCAETLISLDEVMTGHFTACLYPEKVSA